MKHISHYLGPALGEIMRRETCGNDNAGKPADGDQIGFPGHYRPDSCAADTAALPAVDSPAPKRGAHRNPSRAQVARSLDEMRRLWAGIKDRKPWPKR